MKNTQMIKKFYLTLALVSGQEAIKIGYGKPSAEELAYLRANKEAIKDELRAAAEVAKREEIETEKATFRFTVYGWNAHETSVDMRKELSPQFTRIGEMCGLTAVAVERYYKEAVKEAKESKEEAKEAIAKIFATAKASNCRQVLSQETVECDGSAIDCSMDTLTRYAMPDGTVTTVRIHAH